MIERIILTDCHIPSAMTCIEMLAPTGSGWMLRPTGRNRTHACSLRTVQSSASALTCATAERDIADSAYPPSSTDTMRL